MHMDATVGISLGSRRGLDRAKHIDTIFLWVQEYVTKGKIKIGKKHTSEMLADFLTKPVPENIILNALNEMGYKYEEGQHELALRVYKPGTRGIIHEFHWQEFANDQVNMYHKLKLTDFPVTLNY